jgi:RNA recognition motif-containing protein
MRSDLSNLQAVPINYKSDNANIMANKLYVGNLSFSVTEHELTDLFSQYGAVADVKLILDQATGRSRGFGFVTMSTDAEAATAAEAQNGQPFQGRNLTVNEARPQGDRPSGGGGGGYRGGGGGGGKFSGDRKPFGERRGGGGDRGGYGGDRRRRD